MISTTVCPASWKARSLFRTTQWPRWMSGLVGSTPSLTRSGCPRRAARRAGPRAARRRRRQERAAASLWSSRGNRHRANARLTRSLGGSRRPACFPWVSFHRAAPPLAPGRRRAPPQHGHDFSETGWPPGSGSRRRRSRDDRALPTCRRRGRARPRIASGNGGRTAPAASRRRELARPGAAAARGAARHAPKLKKLRFALVLLGLSVLAFVSWIFGIMMAVAQDLPQLENRAQFANAQNSVVYDVNGQQARDPHQQRGPDPDRLGRHRAGDEGGRRRDRGPALLRAPRRRLPGHRPRGRSRTSSSRRHAGRLDDHPAVRQERARGAGQPDRVREAARGRARLPARAPLGQGQDPHRVPERDLLRRGRLRDRGGRARPTSARTTPAAASDGRPAAPRELLPWEAAMLAGIISSRARYDPRTIPRTRSSAEPGAPEHGATRATSRRTSTRSTRSAADPDARRRSSRPAENSAAPYFTSWLRQQLVDQYGAGEAFGGGLKVKSTLDLDLQNAGPGDRRRAHRSASADSARRRARQHDRRRPGDGRRHRLLKQPVQPRHQGPPPAGLVVQAVHPGHRARAGALARPGLHLGAAGDPVQGEGPEEEAARREGRQRALPGPQLRRRVPRAAPRSPPRPPTPTTRSTPSSGCQVGAPRTSPRRRRRWGSRPTSRPPARQVLGRRRPVRALQPGADPRRARDRRHPARDGPRLQTRSPHDGQPAAARWPTPPAARSGSSRSTDSERRPRRAEQTAHPGQDKARDQAGRPARASRRPPGRSSTPWSPPGPGATPRPATRPMGQDRDHREQRRRLVRRRDQGHHRRDLGRLRRTPSSRW